MSYNFHSDLSNDFSQLLKTKIDYNVVIQVGKNPKASETKMPGQEKPLQTEKRTKVPGQENTSDFKVVAEKEKRYQEEQRMKLFEEEEAEKKQLEDIFKEFHAHSSILRIRSEYFNKIFANNDVEKNSNGIYYIQKPNITPQAFDFLLRYIYSGNVYITNKKGTELLDIIFASDELGLKKLTKIAEDFIIENNSQFLRNDPVGILQVVYYHKSLVNLQDLCLDAICLEPQILFKSNNFTQISAPLLETILKRDDLNLDEIEIWENLIKWGLAQLSRNNPTAATSQDVHQEELKRILYKFVPLIRFYEISSDDYINKVKLYEVLLSKEMRDDILKFHMVKGYIPTLKTCSPRYPNCSDVDSNIVNQSHMALFASWIDRKEVSQTNEDQSIYEEDYQEKSIFARFKKAEKDQNEEKYISKKGDSIDSMMYIKAIPYKFNLLYRDSRDKFSPRSIFSIRNTFHEKCDNEGATIIVAKIKGSNQIVGGYNPLDWSGFDYKSTPDSFIFYFNDCKDINTGKIGRVIDPGHAIRCLSNWGPIFGDYKYRNYTKGTGYYNDHNRNIYNFRKPNGDLISGSSNLMMKPNDKWRAISLNASYTNKSSYPDIGIPNCFEVDDYEVFQVKNTLKKNELVPPPSKKSLYKNY